MEAGGLGSSESSGGRAGGVWRPAYLKREGLGDQKRGPGFLNPRSWTGLVVWHPEFSKEKRTGGLGSQKSWRGVELPILEGGRAWRSGFLRSHRTRGEGRTSRSWTSGPGDRFLNSQSGRGLGLDSYVLTRNLCPSPRPCRPKNGHI